MSGQVTPEILSPLLNPARILTPHLRAGALSDRKIIVLCGTGDPARWAFRPALGSTPEITLF